MDRRRFLSGAAGFAGVLACPGWISRAFAQATSPEELATLSDAYRRAQRAGRPLLVIVIPEDAEQRWTRQYAFGEIINHDPHVMRDLALVEVVCATMPTLRTLVPQADGGEPLMVLVETESVPAVVRRLDEPLPDVPGLWIDQGEQLTWEERERREDAVIDQRMAMLAGLVHGAIAADARMIARRAEVARAHLPTEALRDVTDAIAAGQIDRDTAAIAPALVYEAIGGAHGDAMGAVLEELGVERWRRGRIPGSRWATGGGCGISIEGDEDSLTMIACGMGHVPERSARFLYWFGS